MDKSSKIYVAGHTGLVGSAIFRRLKKEGYKNIIKKSHSALDLTKQREVEKFFKSEKPEYVFLAAAKVGGIMANKSYKADFIYDNIMITFNTIHSAYKYDVKKLLFLGSSCVYPKNCLQPIKENYLLSGPLESTNEPYALAKISGIKMCEYYRDQYGCDFISAMPANCYGPNDNYNLDTAHVLPALIRKIHLAKCLENSDFEKIRKDLEFREFSVSKNYNLKLNNIELIKLLEHYGIKLDNGINKTELNKYKDNNILTVNLTLWGSGSPSREYLHSDTLSDCLLFLMDNYSGYEPINVGTGRDIKIKDLAKLIKDIIGFKGRIKWDLSKPDGTHRKLLDVSKLNKLGMNVGNNLKKNLKKVYKTYIKKIQKL